MRSTHCHWHSDVASLLLVNWESKEAGERQLAPAWLSICLLFPMFLSGLLWERPLGVPGGAASKGLDTCWESGPLSHFTVALPSCASIARLEATRGLSPSKPLTQNVNCMGGRDNERRERRKERRNEGRLKIYCSQARHL